MSSVAMTREVRVSTPGDVWLLSRNWDLMFLIGSALLVPLPLLLHHLFGASNTVVSLTVAVLVGGPHLYATYTMTFMEKRFRNRYPIYVLSAFFIPLLVIYLAVVNLTLLLTIFFFWASIHVLHQVAYISDCYRAKDPIKRPFTHRLIDYGLVFSCLYPIASYKLVNRQFFIGKTLLPVPAPFVGQAWVWISVCAVFSLFLVLFIMKTVDDYRQGRFRLSPTLLIMLTVLVGFTLPMMPNLDVAFQGFNTWHSLQYLALVWLINKTRKEHHEISNPVVEKMSGEGNTRRFYFFCVGLTLLAGVGVAAVYRLSGLTLSQSYYIVILSSLLIHYYFDHFMFTQTRVLVR